MTSRAPIDVTPYQEARIASRDPVIELNAAYPVSALRDDTQTSNSGTVAKVTDEAEYRLRHVTTNSFARISSAQRGRYMPGSAAEVGIAVRLGTDTLESGNECIWGYFDMELDENDENTETIKNGLFFGYDDQGYFIQVNSNGNEVHKVYQDDWNLNDTDIINQDRGGIFQIVYNYYVNGSVIWEYVKQETGDFQTDVVRLHSYNRQSKVTMSNDDSYNDTTKQRRKSNE